jgi:hypothetical protein
MMEKPFRQERGFEGGPPDSQLQVRGRRWRVRVKGDTPGADREKTPESYPASLFHPVRQAEMQP